MVAYAPHSLMAGQALAVTDDPHLRFGIHLRLAHSPLLGLPLAPFLVQRVVGHPERFSLRTEVTWRRESDRALLVPPFDLPSGDAAIGTFVAAPGDRAVWAEVDAEPATVPLPWFDLEGLLSAHLRNVLRRAGAGGSPILGLDDAARARLTERLRGLRGRGTDVVRAGVVDPDALRDSAVTRRLRGRGDPSFRGVVGEGGRSNAVGRRVGGEHGIGRDIGAVGADDLDRILAAALDVEEPDEGAAAVLEVADETLVPLPADVADRLRRELPHTAGLIDVSDRIRFDRLRWLRKARVLVEAQVRTVSGMLPAAARSQAPYAVGASHLHQLRVTGRGVVRGARWLGHAAGWSPQQPSTHADRTDLDTKLFGLLGYPIDEVLPRYAGRAGLDEASKLRVERGAPLRLGLHDAPTALPGTAPTASTAAEATRVDALYGHLEPRLRAALTDTSIPQHALLEQHPGVAGSGMAQGDVSLSLVDQVVQGGLDHGLARRLGMLTRDPDEHERGELVVYRILGIFDADVRTLAEEGLSSLLGGGALVTWAEVVEAYGDEAVEELSRRHRPDGALVGFEILLAALAHTPHDRPAAPTVVRADDGRAAGGRTEWRAVTPPDAARRVGIDLDDLGPAAGLALRRTVGSATVSLNPESVAAGRRALEVGRPNGGGVRARRVEDRDAPGDPVTYGVAQADWHGRWSGWSGAPVPEGQRPPPPRPAIVAEYHPAAVPDPVHVAPLTGRIRYELPVPRGAQLPPGGAAIDEVRLEFAEVDEETGATLAWSSTRTLGVPTTGDLRDGDDGPPLARSASTGVRLVGRFVDVDGRVSAPSEPVTLHAVDPRPPPQVVLPDELRYAARPDVRDRSRIDLTWSPPIGAAGFHVFASDEGTLRQVMEAAEGTAFDALLAALDSAGDDAPARATAWRTHSAALPRDAFTLVTAQPLPTTSPRTTYTHTVSGALRTLTLLRVVSVSADNVAADFATAPLVTAAVPTALPPPQPILSAVAVAGDRVEVVVEIPRGATPAVICRLRRSSAVSSDPLQMPIVWTGPVVDGMVAFVDDGASGTLFGEPATVVPWTSYSYVAEVRGATLPGDGSGGRPPPEPGWSHPSQPITVSTVPPAPPPRPSIVAIVRDTTGADLTVASPTELRPGELGPHTVELYRAVDDGRLVFAGGRRIDERTTADPATGAHLIDVRADVDPVAVGTTERWSAIVRDPLGRTSTPSPELTI
jgi:hypothetical protein